MRRGPRRRAIIPLPRPDRSGSGRFSVDGGFCHDGAQWPPSLASEEQERRETRKNGNCQPGRWKSASCRRGLHKRIYTRAIIVCGSVPCLEKDISNPWRLTHRHDSVLQKINATVCLMARACVLAAIPSRPKHHDADQSVNRTDRT